MNTYLINTTLGMFIVMGDNPAKALVEHYTQESHLGDSFITSEELIKRGYSKIEYTSVNNVFLLIKD